MTKPEGTRSDYFTNTEGYKIYCCYWEPEDKPKALVYIAHGFAEHCLVYDELAKELAKLGLYVFANDHMGHGQSEGPRAVTSNVDKYVNDVLQHIDLVRKTYQDLPIYLFGHSMGGTISVKTALRKPKDLKGVVLMGPALLANPEVATPFRLKIAKILGRMIPSFPLTVLDFSLAVRDPAAVKAFNEDPLRYHGYVKVGWAWAMLEAFKELQPKFDSLDIPFFIAHGSNDKICHVSGSEDLYKRSPSKDKSIKVYPKGYHCLLHEPEGIGKQVLNDIVEWYAQRIN